MAGKAFDDRGRYRYAGPRWREAGRDQVVEFQLRAALGIPQGPIPQSTLDGVGELWLDLHKPVVDFSLLSRLPGLTDLTLDSSADIDLEALVAALSNATGLRSLHIEAPVGDIAPLATLTGLIELHLEHTRVHDLSPLARLHGLRTLTVIDAPLWDLSGLSGLALISLSLNDTRVADLASLAAIPSLEQLHLNGSPVRDLTVIMSLPALRHVNVAGTNIHSLGDLPAIATRVEIEGADINPVKPRSAGELFARFRDTTDSAERDALLPQLIATREPRCVAVAIHAMRYSPEPITVDGMLFSDGCGNNRFGPNPWGVPAEADLAQALARIWDPIAEAAPRFVATVKRRTFALILVCEPDGVAELGYLQLDFPDFRPRLRLVRGTWPERVDPTAGVPALAAPMPRPLRDWRAVHETYCDITGYIGGSPVGSLRTDFDDDDDLSFRLGGLPPDRFVTGVGGSDAEYFLLDLDVLDAAGDPTVAGWRPDARVEGTDSGQPHGHKQFWDWLDSDGVDLLFR